MFLKKRFVFRKSLLFFVLFTLFFLLSLFLHARTFTRELIGHHDYISGFILTVVNFWRKEGVLTHTFSPVYSVNPGVEIASDLGVVGKNGRMYYVSYPPLVFIFLYLFSFLPGIGLSVTAPKILSLLCYLAVSLMLFVYVKKHYGLYEALGGVIVYALFPILAYMMGNVYSEDVLIQPLWFLCFLAFRLVNRNSFFNVFLFFLALFLLSLTEWIGIFLGFSLFIYYLISWSKSEVEKSKKPLLLMGFLFIPLFAVMLTWILYSQQIDILELKKIITHKFFYRTNLYAYMPQVNALNVVYSFNEWSAKIFFHLDLGLGHYWYLLFLLVTLVILITVKLKAGQVVKDKLGVLIFFFVIPPFLHLVGLAQFHFAHDFTGLYFSLAIFFLFVFFFRSVSLLCQKYVKDNLFIKIVVIIGVSGFIFYHSRDSYQAYFVDWIYLPESKIEVYKQMKEYTKPKDLIISDLESAPRYWPYIQRDFIGEQKGEQVLAIPGYYPKVENIYYLSDNSLSLQSSCGQNLIEQYKTLFVCRLK